MYYLLVLAVISLAYVEAEDGKRQDIAAEQRQFPQGPQYPYDLQYDFTLLDPQLQYPQILTGDGARLQPQVLLYPGGAPGQPFLLQPGAPPGNFLIPQPQPGVILRDAPPRPPIFVSGYPKPAHIPPINKDAEEIPTNPAAIPPIQPSGRRPEKLETFDLPEKPNRPETEEADVFASPDRNLVGVPPLKPGHRFFILNGQPLFSNYPLPNFINSPFQPSPDRFADPNVLLYRHNGGASFLPDGFNNGLPPYKVSMNGLLARNPITGQINGARPNEDRSQNDIAEQYPQNLISLNRAEDIYNKEGLSLRNSLPIPLQKQNPSPITFLVKARTSEPEKLEPRQKDDLRLRPIEVPDEEDVPLYEGNVKPGIAQLDYFRYRPDDDKEFDRESVIIDAKSDSEKDDVALVSENNRQQHSKYEEPSISQAQPGAVALAGPGGVAAAAPRGTALTGEKGLAVSSPHATAIAGPTRDQIEDKPINIKKEKA